MDVNDGRHFKNPFDDYKSESYTKSEGTLKDEYSKRLNEFVVEVLPHVEHGFRDEMDEGDFSVYTGSSGLALLHLRLNTVISTEDSDDHLKKALDYIKRPLRHLKKKRVTFFCGDAGPLALAAVIYNKLKKQDETYDCLQNLISLHTAVCADSQMADEILYGRAGYLYTLLFVRQHLGDEAVAESVIKKVFDKIIESGVKLSKKESWPCPLLYKWHDSKYLGAAHGLIGIMYVLLQCNGPEYRSQINDLVRPTIDWLITLAYPSGNFPSSIGSSGADRLVHWCHGAPGWVFTFIMAYKVFGDEKYLSKAKQCGNVVWQRGLLRKGYGLCHGTAGNAYTFIALYNLTKDIGWLHKAWKFAEWCFDYGKHGCQIPDTQFSLFEGMAGTLYFLADLLDVKSARFPAYEL